MGIVTHVPHGSKGLTKGVYSEVASSREIKLRDVYEQKLE